MTPGVHRYSVVGIAVLTSVLFMVSMVFLATSSAWDEFGVNGVLWPAPFAAMSVIGGLIGWRRPGHPVAWTLAGAGCLMVINAVAQHHATWAFDAPSGTRPGAHLAAWLSLWSWAPATGLIGLTLILFPTGRPLSRMWKWVSRIVLIAVILTLPAAASIWQQSGPVLHKAQGPSDVPGGAALDLLANGVLGPGLLMLGVVAVALRFRRSRGEERQQLKWLVYAAVIVAMSMAITIGVSFVEQTDDPITHPVAALALLIGMTSIPVAVAVAILKYRLYDIDVVISKTLVFAGLAGFITAIYVGIVVGVGTLLGAGGEPNLALSIVATAVVAVAFQPVRERLTRLANRLVFGRRATPYEVLSTFSSHLAEVASPEQTLERMARLLVDGTGAARAQVWLRVAGDLRPAATWPSHATDGATPEHLVDVVHEGEALGALSLDKQRGETLTPADMKLVDDLAAQAGLVLRNLKLTEDLKAKIVELQASRHRLVAAQDEERRRLERDLHDGAQRQLLELKSRLAAATSTAAEEHADKAGQILEQLAADADDAVATLRELAHGIFPPLLAAEGLAGALTTQATKAAVSVVVEADRIGRYPQDIEAAVYFCVLEAINNAAKYAHPNQVTVRLEHNDGHLTFEVSDDGAGFDPATTVRGHGTTNMADRLDALNGRLELASRLGVGTTIRGWVPSISPQKAVS